MFSDINECDLKPCHVNAVCKNQPGSFTCDCNVGYNGEGILNCRNRAGWNPNNKWHPTRATCIKRRYNQDRCVCVEGFTGNGTECNGK